MPSAAVARGAEGGVAGRGPGTTRGPGSRAGRCGGRGRRPRRARPSQNLAWARKLRSTRRRGWSSRSHSSHQSKAAFITWRARRPTQCPEAAGSAGSMPGGGEDAVALGVRDDGQDRQRRVGGGLFGGPVGEVVHLVQRVLAGAGAALGEAGRPSGGGRGGGRGTGARTSSKSWTTSSSAPRVALQHEQRRARAWGRRAASAAAAWQASRARARLVLAGAGRAATVAQASRTEASADSGSASSQSRAQAAVPDSRARTVTRWPRRSQSSPVAASSARTSCPAALGQRGARGDEFGVVERGVEGLGGALAATAQGWWRWRHRGELPHTTRSVDGDRSTAIG